MVLVLIHVTRCSFLAATAIGAALSVLALQARDQAVKEVPLREPAEIHTFVNLGIVIIEMEKR